jgi:hypothetical protein
MLAWQLANYQRPALRGTGQASGQCLNYQAGIFFAGSTYGQQLPYEKQMLVYKKQHFLKRDLPVMGQAFPF